MDENSSASNAAPDDSAGPAVAGLSPGDEPNQPKAAAIVGKLLSDPLYLLIYRWVFAAMVAGAAADGFFQPIALTAAIMTSIGALGVLLGSAVQAYAAYMLFVIETEGNPPRNLGVRFVKEFLEKALVAGAQYNGWIFILAGSGLILVGAIMAAASVA